MGTLTARKFPGTFLHFSNSVILGSEKEQKISINCKKKLMELMGMLFNFKDNFFLLLHIKNLTVINNLQFRREGIFFQISSFLGRGGSKRRKSIEKIFY